MDGAREVIAGAKVLVCQLEIPVETTLAALRLAREAGVLTVKQTVLALLAGNIVAFPIRALRHQLPRYMGIFSPKMGLQLLLLGQSLRVVSLMVVAMIYYCLF